MHAVRDDHYKILYTEAKGSNPTTGRALLWARNPFGENFNHWQVSRKKDGQIFFKLQHRNDLITKYVYKPAGQV